MFGDEARAAEASAIVLEASVCMAELDPGLVIDWIWVLLARVRFVAVSRDWETRQGTEDGAGSQRKGPRVFYLCNNVRETSVWSNL